MKDSLGSPESIVRCKCHTLLEATRPYVERHHDERYVGLVQTTLTESQMHELIGYRMQLRDLEKAPGFPNVGLPVAPPFFVDAHAIEESFKQQDALPASLEA